MRKYAREMVERYPSIARINEAIAGPRRLGSESSVENYVKAVRKFIAFLELDNPEVALSKLRGQEVNAAAKVDEFIDWALKKYSHGTVRIFAFGVKKWLELAGVNIDWNKIEFPTSTALSETDRAPTKEELKVLLNNANSTRDRTAILLLTSTGLRLGTLLSLNVGDVSFAYSDVASIKVERKAGRKFTGKRRGSQGRVYFTFMTPEARKSLSEYLAQRKNAGEVVSESSPLISDVAFHGKSISLNNFEQCWYRLLKHAGLDKRSHNWYVLHVHSLRKYFRSHCVGVDASYREHWMGHKSGYLDESYFRAEEQQHLSQYRIAVPNLTVYSTPLEEKQLRSRMLVDFAKLQGYSGDELKKLEDVLARAKDVDEAIKEFRRLKDDASDEPRTATDGNGKYLVAHGEAELIQRLHDGYRLAQSLSDEKFLLEHS